MARSKRKKRHKPVHIAINEGHDTAELVRGADPETGTPVAHAINRTQTIWDRLHHEGHIGRLQWQAACDLHALWMKARPIGEVIALDPERLGEGHNDRHVDPSADKRLRRYVRAVGRSNWVVLERLVYDQMDPREWGARRGADGIILTQQALYELATEMGLA